jgi:hypothetical protein
LGCLLIFVETCKIIKQKEELVAKCGNNNKINFVNSRECVSMSYVLGKDEAKVEQQLFTTNLLLAWLKADLTVTTKRMVGE